MIQFTSYYSSAYQLHLLKCVLTLFLFLEIQSVLAQDHKKVALSGELTAQALVSTDIHSLYLNFVAGGIKYKFKNSAVALNVYPAFRYLWDTSQRVPGRSAVTPGLAFGPLFQYKHYIISTPLFYDAFKGRWRLTLGIGLGIDKFFYKSGKEEKVQQ
ncbi:hypothetical protein ACFP1I_23335 [Dyadobacter subterraneus]|uniref:Outer membrane protein beta-barrel domain-containing protein n=1 Tax=Dyadobacter subterraneus TaxID=2773304 RepID=A0ABR9W8X0_9BACT|nr:hypothetical protein [Dyadobacter subterraneus]MBE9461925.1 hypothetical protein [Dyadobacter subterraneus]